MDYPKNLVKAYGRGKKISRAQFIRQFGDWQKANGINYDCKGGREDGFLTLTYRGFKAYFLEDKKLTWLGLGRCFLTADSAEAYKRKVDFDICKNGEAYKRFVNPSPAKNNAGGAERPL